MPIWTFSPPVKIQFLTGRAAQNLLDTPVRLWCVQLKCRPGYSASPQTSAAHNSHSYIYNNITKIPNRQKKSSIFIGESCAVLGFMLHIFGENTHTHTWSERQLVVISNIENTSGEFLTHKNHDLWTFILKYALSAEKQSSVQVPTCLVWPPIFTRGRKKR